MKHLTTTLFLLIASVSMADNRFDQIEAYREIQHLLHVAGEKKAALELANELLPQLNQDDQLYRDVASIINKVDDGNPHFPLDKAIKFGTGTKEEVYCKEIGMVHLKAKHNDGTVSTVKLIQSNRDMGDSYSIVKGGDWVYEFDSEYRTPINSESWLDESSSNSFKIREFRRLENGRFDDGQWRFSWDSQGGYTSSYHTRGQTLEPLPMHMANDYHLWGTYDLGFKINFVVGAKDKMIGRETGAAKIIVLKTDREVKEKLNQFGYSDASGTPHKYNDCFKVVSKIQLDRLEKSKERKKQKKARKAKKAKKK